MTFHRVGPKRGWSLLLGDRMLWGGSHPSGCYGLCVSSDGDHFVGNFLYHPCSIKATRFSRDPQINYMSTGAGGGDFHRAFNDIWNSNCLHFETSQSKVFGKSQKAVWWLSA